MEMYLWKKPTQYSLVYPSSWSRAEYDESDVCDEFTPPTNDAAIHISVYKKRKISPPDEKDAVAIVENFVEKNKLKLQGELKKIIKDYECSCEGHFIHTDTSEPAESQMGLWVVRGLVGFEKGVLASLCLDDNQSKSYSDGIAILSSIKLMERP